jgi:hypothetical protein
MVVKHRFYYFLDCRKSNMKKACQRSPFGAKIWNSYISYKLADNLRKIVQSEYIKVSRCERREKTYDEKLFFNPP